VKKAALALLLLAACGEPSAADTAREYMHDQGYTDFDEISDDTLDGPGWDLCESLGQFEPVSPEELGQFTEGFAEDARMDPIRATATVLSLRRGYCPSPEIEGEITANP
jgi:hypothetical protein